MVYGSYIRNGVLQDQKQGCAREVRRCPRLCKLVPPSSLRGPHLSLHSYLRLPKLQSWSIPWDSNAVFIIFCNFRVPSQNSASFSKIFRHFSLPPPCGKLKLGKMLDARVTLFVGKGCKLENSQEMQNNNNNNKLFFFLL